MTLISVMVKFTDVVVVHTITTRSCLCGLCFSDAVKMFYNFKYICGVWTQILTCLSQGPQQHALFHIGYKLNLFLVS